MAVTGPPRGRRARGRGGAPRTLPRAAPLHRRAYSRYCKAAATLAGIGVRANLGGQDPFRGSATHNRSSLVGAHITLIYMAARLHRLDPAAAHKAGRRAGRDCRTATPRDCLTLSESLVGIVREHRGGRQVCQVATRIVLSYLTDCARRRDHSEVRLDQVGSPGVASGLVMSLLLAEGVPGIRHAWVPASE